MSNITEFTWNGKDLSKDKKFFGEKKAVQYYAPEDTPRDLYFYECDEVVFQTEGRVLSIQKGSQEGQLQANVGVKVFNGRARIES